MMLKVKLAGSILAVMFLSATANVAMADDDASSTNVDYTQLSSDALKTKAASGDDRAEFQMANRALKGLGQPEDASTAFKIFKKLADKGDLSAQLNVGRMYAQGRGTDQDISAAKKYLEVPAKSGDSRALFILAAIEEQTSSTLAKAYSLYKLVASDYSIANAIRDTAQRKMVQLSTSLTSHDRDTAMVGVRQWLNIK